jgi:hypothetical protein
MAHARAGGDPHDSRRGGGATLARLLLRWSLEYD